MAGRRPSSAGLSQLRLYRAWGLGFSYGFWIRGSTFRICSGADVGLRVKLFRTLFAMGRFGSSERACQKKVEFGV